MEEISNPLLLFIAAWGFATLTLIYCAMILFEKFLYHRVRPGKYDNSNAFGSFTTNILASGTALIIGAVVPLLTYVFVWENFRLSDPGIAIWTWVAAFIVHETAYHFGHWAGHRVGFFWAWHQPHHSSEYLNFTTAARGFTFGDPLQALLALSGALIGIHPLVFLTVVVLKNVWGIFNHTCLVNKMGVLETFMATPANHRVHHGRNPKYIDKNYGQVLVIWDRIFGTYEAETEAPDFGLVEPMTSHNPFRIWASGWIWLAKRMKSAPDLSTKLKYLYMPPEWSHMGCKSGCASARNIATLEPAE